MCREFDKLWADGACAQTSSVGEGREKYVCIYVCINFWEGILYPIRPFSLTLSIVLVSGLALA